MRKNRSIIPLLIACLLVPYLATAVPVTIPTPGGAIIVDVSHAGPSGQLVEPDPPSDGGFRPPTIFSAPLPIGSGARALGQAGAFTAVADDATAASWNPAGLVQLESSEVSMVYRNSVREDTHESRMETLEVGRDRYTSSELNYLSAVYPFLLDDRNAVLSLNFQEGYDFTQKFSARFEGVTQQDIDTIIEQTFANSTTNFFSDVNQSLTIIADVTTDARSDINQILNSELLTGIDFEQGGTIDAFSPAFAIDITPRFSMGVALNVYTDGAGRGNPIKSSLTAEYEGTSDSTAGISDTRNSTAVVSWSGEWYSGNPLDPVALPFSGMQTNTFSDVENYNQDESYTVEGRYSEDNTTEDFNGINATIGALWTVQKMTLGAAVDLPWTGRGRQSKQIDHQVSTFDSNRVEVARTVFQETQKRDVEYTFPLYWSVGALWRWSDRLYTSLDVSRTYWSDFSYKADGEKRINPINGEPSRSSALDDCWSVRLGGEYLNVLSWTEIPLRGGVCWEQRPAIGSPDQFWGVSLGTGISFGKVIMDIAYLFERGENLMGSLLPEKAVASDTIKHQLFVSSIWHF